MCVYVFKCHLNFSMLKKEDILRKEHLVTWSKNLNVKPFEANNFTFRNLLSTQI